MVIFWLATAEFTFQSTPNGSVSQPGSFFCGAVLLTTFCNVDDQPHQLTHPLRGWAALGIREDEWKITLRELAQIILSLGTIILRSQLLCLYSSSSLYALELSSQMQKEFTVHRIIANVFPCGGSGREREYSI